MVLDELEVGRHWGSVTAPDVNCDCNSRKHGHCTELLRLMLFVVASTNRAWQLDDVSAIRLETSVVEHIGAGGGGELAPDELGELPITEHAAALFDTYTQRLL